MPWLEVRRAAARLTAADHPVAAARGCRATLDDNVVIISGTWHDQC
jgi:hypothetical protein